MAKKTTTPVPEPLTLYDVNVCGPDAVEIRGSMANEKEIAAWWRRVKDYADAMRQLNRVPMLCYDPDGDEWYFASVPDQVTRLTEGGTA